jgi:hypothetical protein
VIGRRAVALAALACTLFATAGCSRPEAPDPISIEDAYPVVNTFLVGLEQDDSGALDRTVSPAALHGGSPRSDLIESELAAHGGLPIDYGSVVVNSGDGDGRGQFRAKVGGSDETVTLGWVLQWEDGQWYVDLPPHELSGAQIG